MARAGPDRTNEAWVAALRTGGEDAAPAVRDLEGYLGRILRSVMRHRFSDEGIGELVQESVVRIVEHLPSFRGDSAFTTWAAGIATRVAFTELRRASVRDRRHKPFDDVQDEARALAGPRTPSPSDAVARADLLRALESAIATSLTERQRTAILAELRGIPTVEIAERLGTNQNALYKLTHDARKKLKRALLEAGFGADTLRGDVPEVPR